MRVSPVFKSLHTTQLVGGMNKSVAALIFSLGFNSCMLLVLAKLAWFIPIPITVSAVVYFWMSYRYRKEPQLDRIVKGYKRQADIYDPFVSDVVLVGYKRPEGFARHVRC
jgi:hypothetical protein